jgi:hypothetical protein
LGYGENAMPKITTVTVKGRLGTAYNFDVYEYGQEFNALGAVYIVLKLQLLSDKTPFYKYVYVGETGDLSTRFKDHHKQDCFDRLGADRIGVHLDGSEKSRKSKEKDILDGNNWPCND